MLSSQVGGHFYGSSHWALAAASWSLRKLALGACRRELELLRSHPKDVMGALVPGASEGRQPPHFGEELFTIIHFLGEARGCGDIPFSGPPGDPVGSRIRTSVREHSGPHFGAIIELWSCGIELWCAVFASVFFLLNGNDNDNDKTPL